MLIVHLGSGANLIDDGHLAALALERGGEIVSFDHDYARFEGIRVTTPS